MSKAQARKELLKLFTAGAVDAWLARIDVVPEDYVAQFIDYINSLPPMGRLPGESLYEDEEATR